MGLRHLDNFFAVARAALLVLWITGADGASLANAAESQEEMLCGCYSLYVSLVILGEEDIGVDGLYKDLGVSTAKGYSMHALAECAKKRGFHTLLVDTTLDNLTRRPEPFACIAHVDDQSHFLVITGYEPRSQSATIVDPLPVSGTVKPREVDRIALDSRWKGLALLISREELRAEEDLPWSWQTSVLAAGFWTSLGLSLVGGAAYLFRTNIRRRTTS